MAEILNKINLNSCFYCKYGDMSNKLQLSLQMVYCLKHNKWCFKEDLCDDWRYKL